MLAISLTLLKPSEAQEPVQAEKAARAEIQAWQDSAKHVDGLINDLATDIAAIWSGQALREAAFLSGVPRELLAMRLTIRALVEESDLFKPVNFRLKPSDKLLIKDPDEIPGVVLTGDFLIEYARFIVLVPKYRELHQRFQQMAGAQEKIIANYKELVEAKDLQVTLKDSTIARLKDINQLNEKLIDVYRPSALEKFWERVKFPLGMTVGVIVGAVVAREVK